jgi:tRNA-2-methylthio-N6-dimethylallyladenosine synthase
MPTQSPENGARTIYLETFGCQMNELDSELVHGQLSALGYRWTDDPHRADVILYNTCSVRQQAENKALSRVGRVGVWKREGRGVVLGVIGCMAEREGESMVRRYPQIDLLCGPGELDRLPMLIDNAFRTGAVAVADRVALQGSTTRRTATLAAAEDRLELLDLSRAFDPDGAPAGGRAAYVRITRGCNKFCTYCVVPYTRGPEVHRPPDHIVGECRRLADQGVVEVTLLGQTVNHYRYVHGAAVTVGGRETAQVGPGSRAFKADPSPDGGRRATTFAELLRRIHEEVPAIRRLRFVTSFPRDFGEDILEVMAASPRICRYLHLPAQSGSNRILRLMNRDYTCEGYLELIQRARAVLPDVCLAGDFIVGFPTETEADFEATRELMRRVRYKNSFIFKYSPRPGTTAIDRHPDDVPDDVKRRRNNELLALQAEISGRVHEAFVGRTLEVFVERVSRERAASNGNVELRWARPAVQMSGRTGGDLITVFDLSEAVRPDEILGRIVRVRVTAARPLLLEGEFLDDVGAAYRTNRGAGP